LRLEDDPREGFTLFGTLEIADSKLRLLTNTMIVERLSAARIVDVQRGDAPGRARRHSQSH
jgi:hypothetical protein